MAKLNYFSLQYHFSSRPTGALSVGDGVMVHVAFDPDKANEEALFKAEKISRQVEVALGLHTRHEYMFPDGSLYHGVLTLLEQEELRARIQELLPEGYGVSVHKSKLQCDRCPYDFQKEEVAKVGGDRSNVRICDDNYAVECLNSPRHIVLYRILQEGGPGGPEFPGRKQQNRKARRKSKAVQKEPSEPR